MPLLQSCATVQYVLGETKPELTYRDLEIDSPYNTYLYPDLLGHRLSGAGSAQAALYPAHEIICILFIKKMAAASISSVPLYKSMNAIKNSPEKTSGNGKR